MISDARGGHVSPGVYTEEKDVLYSAKSLGITSLGLVGETVKGPAFQAIPVTDWADFVDYFGGTSSENFRNGLPKYELPYIAKEYLKQSENLNVVRVLGLSGYETSPAFGVKLTITGVGEFPVVILRSKGDYNGSISGVTDCTTGTQEKFRPFVSSVTVQDYATFEYTTNCVVTPSGKTIGISGTITSGVPFDTRGNVMGSFGLKVGLIDGTEKVYNVSLDPYSSDYIYKVFSNNPLVGSAPLFVEAVYDKAYEELLKDEKNNEKEITFSALGTNGKGFINKMTLYKYDFEMSSTTLNTGETELHYGAKEVESVEKIPTDNIFANSPQYYYFQSGRTQEEQPKDIYWFYVKNANDKGIAEDATDYKETYRCAQTPWFVSEVKGATTSAIDIKKLFKFYTISDGNAANYQVKISIQRIRPEEGLFDVVIRDFYDTDESQIVLEKFMNCSMMEGEANYIGLKIGTFDGGYEAKSKYVTVEISNEDGIETSVPCGFLGYPIPTYGLTDSSGYPNTIKIAYNTAIKDTIKPKRQYFGLTSEILDEDILNYKGVTSYNNNKGDADAKLISNGFHLDAIIHEMSSSTVFVDGESGYSFTTVDAVQYGTQASRLPRIFAGYDYENTIYEDINFRKFTVYPYGGFDGWDIYRPERTNTNKFKATKYQIIEGCPFEKMGSNIELDPMLSLGLPTNAINSDYYAYLAGYKQFANPQDIDINLFATPGIDFGKQSLLVEDALDVIEDPEDGRGGDALYIINSPMSEEYESADDVVSTLEDSELDSSYACTYWPWIKYYDATDRKYITLPVTKDVVRNIAETDNNSYPWFAPAGTERGSVDCIKAQVKTTLSDEDTLYEGRINPIKSFAQDGVKVWGNKTLYSKETPLNRINVRRLMIRIKKLIVEASKHLIFEQYDDTLEKQFRNLVEPILSNVKSNRGIIDYRVQTESTPETRDQHILPARIMVKPTQALEYISISFVVYPESVSFDE